MPHFGLLALLFALVTKWAAKLYSAQQSCKPCFLKSQSMAVYKACTTVSLTTITKQSQLAAFSLSLSDKINRQVKTLYTFLTVILEAQARAILNTNAQPCLDWVQHVQAQVIVHTRSLSAAVHQATAALHVSCAVQIVIKLNAQAM